MALLDAQTLKRIEELERKLKELEERVEEIEKENPATVVLEKWAEKVLEKDK